MLYLVGLGIGVGGLSIKGLEILKKCERVYREVYTNQPTWEKKEIEKLIGKKIVDLSREEVEAGEFVLSAKKEDVGLLVSGDPLTGTTHISLVLHAIENGVRYEVIHASSIFTGVGESGISCYKFGRVVTLPLPKEGFEPKSPYVQIKKNLEQGLHTLVLLDIGMDVKEGVGLLLRHMKGLGKILVLSRLGTDGKKIFYEKPEVFLKKRVEIPACFVIPGKLHFMEKKAIERIKK
jgi:diphthine synthase